jgi:spore coat polysaccharide biosynthesis predicted glycosyltransferase SpsG
MFSMNSKIDLKLCVTGGRAHGLGHVFRTTAIAQEAIDAGLRVAYALDGDEDARRLVVAELPTAQVESWCPQSSSVGESAKWFLFDTKRPIAKSLSRVRSLGAKSLVLDRLDHADHADLTIIPALHQAPYLHPRVRQGSQFCVLSHHFLDRSPPQPETTPYLLLSLGGADPGKISTRVAQDLAHCLELRGGLLNQIEVRFVVGPAFGERPKLEAQIDRYGWRVERAPSRAAFAQLLHGATLAVLGFGISIYEAAYLGVPAIYITHHAEDIAGARRMESFGLGRFGASLHSYESARVRAALGFALNDARWRGRASQRGREVMGTGRGAHRILSELELASELPSGAARKNQSAGSVHT